MAVAFTREAHMFGAIVIDWNGKQLTGEQILVLQRAAAQFPERDKGIAYLVEHKLCEGLITCKGESSVGTFSGTVFHAYLGEYKGKPWTHEFMLVAGFDEAEYANAPVSLYDVDHAGVTITPIDKREASGAKLTKLRKQ